jgi:hypothetical protein
VNRRTTFSVATASLALAFSMGVSAQAIFVAPSGNVGVGTNAPIAQLEVIGDDAKANANNTTALYVTNESATVAGRTMLGIENNGPARFQVTNTASVGASWVFTVGSTASFRISKADTPIVEFEVLTNGNAKLAGVLVENSDVNSKQDFEIVDGNNILGKLRRLEISEWSYKDAPTDRHVGPMAQEFYAAFGLGNTDKGIATLDTSGIALAAIKALIEENTSLKERLTTLESQQAEIQAVMVKVLENQQEQRVLTSTVMN